MDFDFAASDDAKFGVGKSLLDIPLMPNSEPEPQIPLPFVFVPSQPAEVETSATASDVVRMVDGFAAHAAKHGIALTIEGNIKLADARELVAKLATGDIDERVTSSLDFRWLTLIDDLASSSGAVERLQTQIRSDLAWFDLDATDKATQLAQLVLHGGFLSSTEVAPPWLDEQRELLDDGVPHWVSLMLVEGTVLPVEDVTTQALEVVAMQQPDQRAQVGADFFDTTVVAAVGELFEGLERFGLVIWHGRDRSTQAGSGIEYSSGGEIELTPLGRHLFPDIVRQAGYTFDQVAGIEDASPQQMVRVALSSGLSGAEVLSLWRTDLELANRLELVAGCVIHGDAPERLVGFKVFNAADDPAMVAPIVRQLLDSPAGSYAADYLLDHDLATSEDVGAFINLTPVVDMLSVFGGDTEMFDQVFQNAAQMIDGDFIEELWRHDQAEVAWVLDTAGTVVTDKSLAKAARKAAIKHRSWLANQGR